jgi:hypothetical protein
MNSKIWVTEHQLKTAIARAIADRAERAASQARAEGREELAKLWEWFTLNAIGEMPMGSEANGNETTTNADQAVIEAAEAFDASGSGKDRRRLSRAISARRQAVRS